VTGTVGRLAIAWWDHGVLARQFARRDTVSITLCELRGYFEMMVPYQSATGVMLTLHHLEHGTESVSQRGIPRHGSTAIRPTRFTARGQIQEGLSRCQLTGTSHTAGACYRRRIHIPCARHVNHRRRRRRSDHGVRMLLSIRPQGLGLDTL